MFSNMLAFSLAHAVKPTQHHKGEHRPYFVYFSFNFIVIISFLAERLADFTVAVGSSFDPDRFDPRGFTTCAHVEGHLDTSETRTIQCEVPVSGRYVTLYLTQKTYLTLCELAVHGDLVVNFTDPGTHIVSLTSLEKAVDQS